MVLAVNIPIASMVVGGAILHSVIEGLAKLIEAMSRGSRKAILVTLSGKGLRTN